MVCAAVAFGVSSLCWSAGLAQTTATNGALVMSSSPIAGVLFSAALGLEQLRRRTLAAAVLCFGGVILVILGKPGAALAGGKLTGDLLMVASSWGWALMTVFVGPVLRAHSPLVSSTATIAGTLVLILPVSLPSLIQEPYAAIPLVAWAGLAYTCFFTMVVPMLLWYHGVRRLGPNQAMLYFYCQVLFAVLLGIALLGETVALVQFAGALVVFLGLGLANGRRRTKDG